MKKYTNKNVLLVGPESYETAYYLAKCNTMYYVLTGDDLENDLKMFEEFDLEAIYFGSEEDQELPKADQRGKDEFPEMVIEQILMRGEWKEIIPHILEDLDETMAVKFIKAICDDQ